MNPTYKYIEIHPRTTTLEVMLEDHSEFNKGVAHETRLALATPELLAVIARLLSSKVASTPVLWAEPNKQARALLHILEN